MKQEAFFMELGAYKAYKASALSESERQMYFLIIKEDDVIILRIGVSKAITLNPRVSGVSADYVYDWLWNQGLSFLHDYGTEYQTLLDKYKINAIQIIIDENLVKSGEFSAPWEDFIVKGTDKDIT